MTTATNTQYLRKKAMLDQDRTFVLLLVLIVMLGAALRLYDLGAESYWFDEIIMVHTAGGNLESIWGETQVGRPPLYVILAHFWMQVFGTSEIATRSLSALAGIVSIIVMCAIGRELFGRKVGLLSAFLMTISEFQIHFSQEHRYYSIFLLMTLLSFFYYIRMLTGQRPIDSVLYVLASIMMFYSHTYGTFTLISQVVYFLLQWKKYERVRALWFLCQILILVSIGPGLFIATTKILLGRVADAAKDELMWQSEPTVWSLARTILKYVFPGRHNRSWEVPTLLSGVAFFFVGTLFFYIWKGREKWFGSLEDLANAARGLSSKKTELLLVICWFICPILLPFALSKLITPMYISKYTIAASPAFYIFLALGVSEVGKVVPELISLGFLLILIVPGLQGYYVKDVKEQWREVATYIEENSVEDDVIVFAPDERGWQRKSFYWYYQGELSGCDITVNFINDDKLIECALAKCSSDAKRFWLVVRGPLAFTMPVKRFFVERNNKTFSMIREREFISISVYLFAIKNL
jgi:4-amino-4-deoxy-L-arabinose transferase-like glycosyltransferase